MDAEKHAIAYPKFAYVGSGTIHSRSLAFRLPKARKPKKGTKEAQPAEPGDTWESYMEKYAAWDTKVITGKTYENSIKETGPGSRVHMAYENLPDIIKKHVISKGYPSKESDWTWEYLGKHIKTCIDTGGLVAGAELTAMTEKLKRQEKQLNSISTTINAVGVNGIDGGSKDDKAKDGKGKGKGGKANRGTKRQDSDTGAGVGGVLGNTASRALVA